MIKNTKLKAKKVIALALISFILTGQLSGSDYGMTGAQILDMYTSARIMAMGNAGAGLADDLNVLVYNPAGLSQLRKIQVQATHMFYYVGTRMESLSYAQKIGEITGYTPGWGLDDVGFGFKWKYFYAKDTARDESGEEGKSFDIVYAQYSAGVGSPLTKRISMGLTVNTVYEKVYTEKDTFLGVDLGWQYKLSMKKRHRTLLRVRGWKARRIVVAEQTKSHAVGLVIKNIGRKLPFKLVLGGSHGIPWVENLITVWEIFTNFETNYGYKCGVEGEIEGFKARAGFVYITKPSITIGFGVPEGKWRIDYAFLYHWDLGITHRVSLGANF